MAGQHTHAFDESNFEQAVLNSDKPVLVDFWAEWCGPCRAIAPTIDEVAEELNGTAVVGKVNVDEAPQLAVRFSISSIPSVLVFSGGEVVARLVGLQDKQRLLEAVQAAVSPAS